MSILESTSWAEAILYALVKGPGYGLLRLIHAVRDDPREPRAWACWSVGLLVWVLILGLGWLWIAVIR